MGNPERKTYLHGLSSQKDSCLINVTGGRYAALGDIIEEEDLDIPIPLMVPEESGDVPTTRVTGKKEVVPAPEYSADTVSIRF